LVQVSDAHTSYSNGKAIQGHKGDQGWGATQHKPAAAVTEQQGGGDDGGVKAEAEASTSAAQTELGQHQKGDLLLDVLNKPITQDGDMLVGLGDYFVGKGQREAAAICFAQATALGAGAEDATRRKQALIQLKQGIQQINKEEKEA
jgi:hypothetical protein